MDFKNNLIQSNASAEDALQILNNLGEDLVLFVIDGSSKLVGTVTDGDLRRGFLKGLTIHKPVKEFMNSSFYFVSKGEFTFEELIKYRKKGVKLLPVLDEDGAIINVYNFSKLISVLPMDAVIMAGGEGQRLRPLTENTPKPLLKVGSKPIIEHLVDRLIEYGINNIYITINYLGEQIVDYFGDGSSKGVSINYIHEKEKLGTAGSLGLISEFHNKTILLINSDILTNIDFEEYYRNFIESDADLMVACISYKVNIPYAIFEMDERKIVSLREKPTLNFYSNGGIYMMRNSVHDLIPQGKHYNATELIEDLIGIGKNVSSYPVIDYWLDIGKMDDFLKAQEDIKHLKI
jgi:dTDP-glucose pyrophosphorylase